MDLNTVQEIERAIEQLPPAQFEQLSEWFEERYAQAIDARLKTDIEAGRFDDRIDRATAEHKAGRTRCTRFGPRDSERFVTVTIIPYDSHHDCLLTMRDW